MALETLSRRTLNRALLARQMLLAREAVPAVSVVARLAGLQAQQARPPFVWLWSRVAGFARAELLAALSSAKVLRATGARGTLHLMTREDYVAWRPALQPMLTAGMESILRERLKTFDGALVLDVARRAFLANPRTFTSLRDELVAAFPEGDERAMGYFSRMNLAVASVFDAKAVWGFGSDAEFGLVDAGGAGDAESLVLRYLSAFGPATVADFQAWSGLKGAAPVFERLKGRLVEFQDEKKRRLYDLPESPRPDEGAAAPARFIAEFDNVLLAHADRVRIVAEEHRPRVVTKNLLVLGTFLVDGFVAGIWKSERKKKEATLRVEAFEKLSAQTKKALAQEGEALIRFLEFDADSFKVLFE